MNFDEIKRYWEERAAFDPSAQSTTQDIYLREIEARVLCDVISKFSPRQVLDIGCGDARTTIRLASAFPEINFRGTDYSSSMLLNANANVRAGKVENVQLAELDITQSPKERGFDLVYTTRCLINLPNWQLQQRALSNIHEMLNDDGLYVMIENFIEGHQNFNQVREAFGLRPIPIRNHNLYFDRVALGSFVSQRFEVVEETNISSTYYLVSRIIYSKICEDKSVEPDYFDDHHRFGSALPFCGEFGPVRMLCLRKA